MILGSHSPWFVLTTLGAFLSLTPVSLASTGNLTVEIDGFKNQSGQVCLSLFTKAEGFPKQSEKAEETKCVQITQTPLEVTFKDLQFGKYAIAVLHDANSDNKINSNFLGIPNEGFGFSKNPELSMGAPKFNQAAFFLNSDSTNIQIKLRYLL
jgi:uncharacterized protein (DUF2141 family)